MKKIVFSLLSIIIIPVFVFCGCDFENKPRKIVTENDTRYVEGWVEDFNDIVDESLHIGDYTLTQDKNGMITVSDEKNTYILNYYSDGVVLGTLKDGSFIEKYQSSRAMLTLLSGFSGKISDIDACVDAVNLQIDDLIETISNCRNEFDASMDEAGIDVDGYIENLSDLVNDYIDYREYTLKPQLDN